MKVLSGFIFIVLMGLIGLQLYRLEAERRLLAEETRELQGKVAILRREHEEARADIIYYSKPENLLKEIRTLFNLARPSEELFVVVPTPQRP